jgi:phage baseplate assembly protein W
MIEGKKYVDLDFDFKSHPVTKDVVLKYNEEAVKKSLKSLILTSKYERPFQPSINSRIKKLLFENITPVLGVNLKSNIEDVIREHEPRVDLRGVDVILLEDNNEILVNIYFSIKNEPEVVSLTTTLQRTR